MVDVLTVLQVALLVLAIAGVPTQSSSEVPPAKSMSCPLSVAAS